MLTSYLSPADADADDKGEGEKTMHVLIFYLAFVSANALFSYTIILTQSWKRG